MTDIPFDPAGCRRKILDLYGEEGAAWIARLPGLLAAFARRWDLEIKAPFPGEAFSYVCPVVRLDRTLLVLKLSLPDREVSRQAQAPVLDRGRAMSRLVDADPEGGILLLERLLPGTPLSALLDDARSVEIAALLMQRAWRSVPAHHDFTTVARWVAGLDRWISRSSWPRPPFPLPPVVNARSIFAELLASGEPEQFIHGDPNLTNILSARRYPWLLIDPKGVVGHPLYDVAVYLNNLPLDRPLTEVRRLLHRRLAQFAEILSFPLEQVRLWGRAQAVLSGVWRWVDHLHGWEPTFAVSELYDP